jgi:hypothetical protein
MLSYKRLYLAYSAFAVVLLVCILMSLFKEYKAFEHFTTTKPSQQAKTCEKCRICPAPCKYVKKPPYQVITNDKWVYDEAPNLALMSFDGHKMAYTQDVEGCQTKCTYDGACLGYTYDKRSKECYMLPSIDKVQFNSSLKDNYGSGFKVRPTLNDPDFKSFDGFKLPDSQGTITTLPNVSNVYACAQVCEDAQSASHDPSKPPCVAFEYDYVNETCKINSSVIGKLQTSQNHTTGMKMK